MIYSFEPFKSESLPNSVSVDGYMEKEDLLGPYRMDGEIVYYDPSEGKMLNPKVNAYVRNNANLFI
jgi:hypothetical protein